MIDFSKLLGIEGYKIKRYTQTRKYIYFEIYSRRKTGTCPKCKVRTKVVHTRKERKIKHTRLLGKVVILKVEVRRFLCRRCSITFTEEIKFLERRRERESKRFKKEVLFDLTRLSYRYTALKYKISTSLILRWVKEVGEKRKLDFGKEKERGEEFVLGIDEVAFSKRRFLTTIGNVTHKRLKAILNSSNKQELKKALKSIEEQVVKLIKGVVIDMNKYYLRAVKEVFGERIKVVIDKFHLIYYVNRKIEEERLFIRSEEKVKIDKYLLLKNKDKLTEKEKEKLKNILKKHSRLRFLYVTKLRLQNMYKSKDRDEAEVVLTSLIKVLKNTSDGELITFGNTLSYFKPYILNYFQVRETNAFMEGINTTLKLIKRISFGFKNKENFINKILLWVLFSTSLYHPNW